jgi:hypothetical protein
MSLNTNMILGKALSLESTETVVYRPTSSDKDIFSSTDNAMHSCTNGPPVLASDAVRSVKIDHSDAMFFPKHIDKVAPIAPPKKVVKEVSSCLQSVPVFFHVMLPFRRPPTVCLPIYLLIVATFPVNIMSYHVL